MTKCPECGFQAATTSGLATHFWRKHPGVTVQRECGVDYCIRLTRFGFSELCDNHYSRKRRGITDYTSPSPREKELEVRFWEKVNKNGGLPDFSDELVRVGPQDGECWLWTASCADGRYGVLGDVKAHRISYEMHHGAIPVGLHLDHLCRRTLCVNPQHLEAVSPRENSLRSNSIAARNARKTHCKRGHEFVPGSYYVKNDGARQCKACNVLYQKSRETGVGTTKPPPVTE